MKVIVILFILVGISSCYTKKVFTDNSIIDERTTVICTDYEVKVKNKKGGLGVTKIKYKNNGKTYKKTKTIITRGVAGHFIETKVMIKDSTGKVVFKCFDRNQEYPIFRSF